MTVGTARRRFVVEGTESHCQATPRRVRPETRGARGLVRVVFQRGRAGFGRRRNRPAEEEETSSICIRVRITVLLSVFGSLTTSGRHRIPKKRKTSLSAGHPKRPLSAFMYFSQEKRSDVKADNPETSFGDLGKILGQMWKDLSEDDKKVNLKEYRF